MNWLKTHQRSALICGLTLLLPALIYINALFGTLAVRAEYVDDIDNLEPRIARLLGLMAFEEQLLESSAEVQNQASSLAHPANANSTSVAAGMQTDIRQLFEESGLSVSNSQVLPVREEDKFDFISLKLTVAGDVGALDEALTELARYKPLVMVAALDVWPTRQRRSRGAEEVQEVTASIRLLSLRSVI